MSLSWNLLNYPALHLQRRRRHRIITSLTGMAVGALLAWASLLGVERSLQGLRLQKIQLQAQWLEASQQLKLQQRQVAERDRHRHQIHHLRQIAEQHQAWTGLHEALLSEAQEETWRLTRLQLDLGKLALSGWSRDFDALNVSRLQLTARLQAHWPKALGAGAASNAAPSAVTGSAPIPTPAEWVRQTSVNTRDGSVREGGSEPFGVEFVWASQWPTFQPIAAQAKNVVKADAP